MELVNKALLETGGTGSFGNVFVRWLLRTSRARELIFFSRDEQKQNSMVHALRVSGGD